MALGYAGVALVLALLIPAMLVWQCRKTDPLGGLHVWQAAPSAGAGAYLRHIVIGVQFRSPWGSCPIR